MRWIASKPNVRVSKSAANLLYTSVRSTGSRWSPLLLAVLSSSLSESSGFLAPWSNAFIQSTGAGAGAGASSSLSSSRAKVRRDFLGASSSLSSFQKLKSDRGRRSACGDVDSVESDSACSDGRSHIARALALLHEIAVL